jgi:hypothetical protein
MNAWLMQMFRAGQVSKGGIIRRSVRSVIKYGGGREALIIAAKKKGFHVIKTGRQFVVLCHPGKQVILC